MIKQIFMMAALAIAATTADAQQAVHGVNRADMDLSVRPGDDFFQYSGGGWLKANPMKPEYSRYGVFNDLAETKSKSANSSKPFRRKNTNRERWDKRLPTSLIWQWTAPA